MCSEYSNAFEYLLTNILIRLNTRRFFLNKYIGTFIRGFFLFMNIFRYSVGMLDSNEYIQIKVLNIILVIKKKLDSLTFQRLIL